MLVWADRVQALTREGKLSIVLASASPRRKEILTTVLLHPTSFTCRTSQFEETLDKAQFASAGEYALATARGKARDIAKHTGGGGSGGGVLRLVIGADTVVEGPTNHTILEKPADAAKAKEMLLSLVGQTHKVHTGVVVYEATSSSPIERFSFIQTTEVTFASDISAEVIDAYVASGEPFDKAGGYGIQGLAGACLVSGIRGDYFNVVGFPAFEFSRRLTGLLDERFGGK